MAGIVSQTMNETKPPLVETIFTYACYLESHMKPTGVVYHTIYLQHDTGSHPERKERLTAILDKIHSEELKVEFITPKQATVDQVAAVHEHRYIDQVKSICEQGGGHLDLDTVLSRASYDAALMAAGGTIAAVDAVLGRIRVRLCPCAASRPSCHAQPRDGVLHLQ